MFTSVKEQRQLAAVLGIGILVASGIWVFQSVGIREGFGWGDTLQFLAPILLASLLVERAVAVLKTAWREPGESELRTKMESARFTYGLSADAEVSANTPQPSKSKASQAPDSVEGGPTPMSNYLTAREKLAAFEAETTVVESLASMVMGLTISAAGLRILDHIASVCGVDALGCGQKSLFIVTDVFITGLAIGGGSAPLRELIKLFTLSVVVTKEKLNKQKPNL